MSASLRKPASALFPWRPRSLFARPKAIGCPSVHCLGFARKLQKVIGDWFFGWHAPRVLGGCLEDSVASPWAGLLSRVLILHEDAPPPPHATITAPNVPVAAREDTQPGIVF